MATVSGHVTLAELVARAASRIERLDPHAAFAELGEGARLVDIRSDLDRVRDGVVPGALHVPRTVLEWRFEPDGQWRSPYACGREDRVVLICDHGFSSVFAAAMLVDLGYRRAADVVGGFEAWLAAELPVGRCEPRPPDTLPGMGPLDA